MQIPTVEPGLLTLIVQHPAIAVASITTATAAAWRFVIWVVGSRVKTFEDAWAAHQSAAESREKRLIGMEQLIKDRHEQWDTFSKRVEGRQDDVRTRLQTVEIGGKVMTDVLARIEDALKLNAEATSELKDTLNGVRVTLASMDVHLVRHESEVEGLRRRMDSNAERVQSLETDVAILQAKCPSCESVPRGQK